MESKLILFDVDGTLIDTAGAGKRARPDALLDDLSDPGIMQALGLVE